MPQDIAVDSISNCQTAELNRLKAWLYRRRTQARQERDRGESLQKREEKATKRKTEQPALFEF
jgi:hypothetical protein